MRPGDRPAVVPLSSGQLDRPEFDTAALEVVHWRNVFAAHQHPEKTSPAPKVVFCSLGLFFPQVTDNNLVHFTVNVCSGLCFCPLEDSKRDMTKYSSTGRWPYEVPPAERCCLANEEISLQRHSLARIIVPEGLHPAGPGWTVDAL